MPAPVTNISCYKFASLDGLKELRAELQARCARGGLKGTVLLSPEGINLFLAGPRAAVDELVGFLRSVPGLADLAPKYSDSDEQPFRRMLVKIKKEIIAFGVDGIDPAKRTVPKLPARTLKQWLDEGRPVTLLDTRNDYEVRLGTFRGALPAGINQFRDFPAAVAKLPPRLKDEPVVMFCTGGIRCEKAGPFMERAGFKHVLQLDGGILKYFEEVGGDHYDGECFVFDDRVGVDPALRETHATVCHACLAPLTAEEQADPRYVASVSCPYCFRTTEQQRGVTLARRHEILRGLAAKLPGAAPYENRRPFLVPPAADGLSLLDCVNRLFGYFGRDAWAAACGGGALRTADGDRACGADHVVRAGERYVHVQIATTEPDVAADIRVLHEDDALVVVHKPAPLPMHPSGRFNRNTLEHLFNLAFAPHHPRAAHRLDANTTGVVVCARTRHQAGKLQPQFARGDVEKLYLVRVHGHPSSDAFRIDAPIGEANRDAGVRAVDAETGRAALTEFRVLARDADGTALLEAIPRTGRTNQIRAHLWHHGFPVVGDPSYLRDGTLGTTQTLPVGAPPLCLHAWKITVTHPTTGERKTFEAEPPAWARRT